MKCIQRPTVKTTTNVIVRDSRGQVLPGSILNPDGRPRGVLTYGGKTNRQKREFFLTKFYEKMEENWEMIYDNLVKECKDRNLRALLGTIEYMIPKLKERDIEITQSADGISKEEIKAQMIEALMELRALNDKYMSKEEDVENMKFKVTKKKKVKEEKNGK